MRLIVLIGAAVLAGCSSKPEAAPVKAEAAKEEAAPEASKEVTLDAKQLAQAQLEKVTVKSQALPETVASSGRITVNENRSWHVGAVTDGKIIRVHVYPGDRVKKDQLLAGMHSHDIHEARAEYRKAVAEEARLKTALSYSQRHRDRAKRLYDLKAGSLEQLEHAEAELKNTQSAVENSHTELDRTKRHLVEFLQVPLEDHDEHEPGDTAHDGDLIPVKAPADGVVIDRHVTAGSVANQGDELFLIADLSTVWMIAAVNEEHLGKIRTGMTVKVNVQAYPEQPFAGRITRLGDQMDAATRTAPVRIELANPSGRLKPEMYATAEIAAGATAQAAFIPQEALQQIENSNVVFVETKPGTFEAREVETGRVLRGDVEVRKGLRPGEVIVAKGSYTLKSQLLKGSLE
ncbi:MAG: efflux RND transporter periplasmic adaptor subunit [Bryobacterales bacterium]|nr:efflux RND transporter periplasmic adaptor subunit [Bryobacterales bacterium]